MNSRVSKKARSPLYYLALAKAVSRSLPFFRFIQSSIWRIRWCAPIRTMALCIIIRFRFPIKCFSAAVCRFFLLFSLCRCLLLYLLYVIRRATTQFSYTADSLLFSIVATVFIQIELLLFFGPVAKNGAKNHKCNSANRAQYYTDPVGCRKKRYNVSWIDSVAESSLNSRHHLSPIRNENQRKFIRLLFFDFFVVAPSTICLSLTLNGLLKKRIAYFQVVIHCFFVCLGYFFPFRFAHWTSLPKCD